MIPFKKSIYIFEKIESQTPKMVWFLESEYINRILKIVPLCSKLSASESQSFAF